MTTTNKESKWSMFFKRVINLMDEFTKVVDNDTLQLFIACSTAILIVVPLFFILCTSFVGCVRISKSRYDKFIENGYVQNVYKSPTSSFSTTVWQKEQINGMTER
mgnify:CR=1 FL=1